MEPTNRSTYKRQSMSNEFTNSCLGKIIILAIIAFILLIVAIATVPSEEEIRVQMTDDIRECIQDNYEKRCDPVDEVFNNIRRPFTEADTTFNDKEILKCIITHCSLHVVWSITYILTDCVKAWASLALSFHSSITTIS